MDNYVTALSLLALLLSGCHFCADEINALWLAIPGVPLGLAWFKAFWRRRHQKPVCVHPNGHPPRTWEDFIPLYLEWASATFPHQTPMSVMKHLRKEVEELHAAVLSGTGQQSEIADVLLLTLNLAYQEGIDPFRACVEKLAENQKRRWGKPDNDGVSYHIKDGDGQ